MTRGVARFDEREGRTGLREVGEISRVEVRGHNYTFIYGHHNTEQPHPPIENFNCIVLEGVGNRLSEDVSNEGLQSVQYRALVEEARRLKKPIFLPDIVYDPNLVARETEAQRELEKILGISLILPAVVAGAGAANMNKGPHRRNVLFGAAALFGALGAGVLGKTAVEDAQSRRTNPEVEERTVLELKNAVISQKSETIANLMGDVAIVIGAAHGDIENSMRDTPTQRAQDALRALHKIERSSGAVVANRILEQIALITRLDYDEAQEKWRLSVVEDPFLAKLRT